jgi:hypothetical protein
LKLTLAASDSSKFEPFSGDIFCTLLSAMMNSRRALNVLKWKGEALLNYVTQQLWHLWVNIGTLPARLSNHSLIDTCIKKERLRFVHICRWQNIYELIACDFECIKVWAVWSVGPTGSFSFVKFRFFLYINVDCGLLD